MLCIEGKFKLRIWFKGGVAVMKSVNKDGGGRFGSRNTGPKVPPPPRD